jgi:FkbM family methyltransferase
VIVRVTKTDLPTNMMLHAQNTISGRDIDTLSPVTKVRFVKASRIPALTPMLTIEGRDMRFFAALRKLMWNRHFEKLLGNSGWRLLQRSNGLFQVEHEGDRLWLGSTYLFATVLEWNGIWNRFYVPDFSLKGKAVLDVGAGCGETAHFYLLRGASRVVAVEPDPTAVTCIRKNIAANRWPVLIIPRKFQLDDLNLEHDFMKMDGEGCEELLLQSVRSLRPSTIEVHTRALAHTLAEKLNGKIVGKLPKRTIYYIRV